MNRNMIHKAYDSINPDDAAKARMLDAILESASKERSTAGTHARRVNLKRTILAAAAVAVLAAFSVTAYAANLFGLREAILGSQEITLGDGQSSTAEIMSLQGFAESPEYKANREWQEFLTSYDRDGAILKEVGNSPTEFDEKYSPYLCYTQEMADKIDEICKKYSLKLLSGFSEPQTDEEFFAAAGTGEIYRSSADGYGNLVSPGYVYEDGSFQFSGSAWLTSGWPYTIKYEFKRCMKGSFDSSVLNIGNTDDYTQWNYTAKNGVELTLAQSDGKELIIVDRTDSFIVVNLYDVAECDIITGELHKTPEDLEAFAEIFDFSAVS